MNTAAKSAGFERLTLSLTTNPVIVGLENVKYIKKMNEKMFAISSAGFIIR